MSTSEVLAKEENAPRGVRRRTSADVRAFARAWVLLLAADLGLRAFPFRYVDRRLSPKVSEVSPLDELVVGRLVWATEAAARHHLYPMRCLPKALCLRWLLGRQGIAAELRIGVARQGERLAAHAWVEYQGRPVGEAPGLEERFSPLDSAASSS